MNNEKINVRFNYRKDNLLETRIIENANWCQATDCLMYYFDEICGKKSIDIFNFYVCHYGSYCNEHRQYFEFVADYIKFVLSLRKQSKRKDMWNFDFDYELLIQQEEKKEQVEEDKDENFYCESPSDHSLSDTSSENISQISELTK